MAELNTPMYTTSKCIRINKGATVINDFTYFALFSLSSIVDVFDLSSSIQILLPHMSQCHIAHNRVEPSDDSNHGEEDECLEKVLAQIIKQRMGICR